MSIEVPVEPSVPVTDGPGPGLTTAEVEQAHRGNPGGRKRRSGSRSYWDIVKTNVFSFYNNILFVIGVGLLALDRINDAVVSVGLGLINAVIGAVQEMRAKRQLDQLSLLYTKP
jgi:cation-transporting ATPase E